MKTICLFVLALMAQVVACSNPDKPAQAGAGARGAELALPAAPATVTLDSGGGQSLVLELGPDGTVSSGGRELARLSGPTLLVAGKPVMSLTADGLSVTAGGAAVGSFAQDSLTIANGGRLSIADDGTLTMVASDGAVVGKGTTQGFAEAKRTALFLVAAWLLPVGESASSTSPVP